MIPLSIRATFSGGSTIDGDGRSIPSVYLLTYPDPLQPVGTHVHCHRGRKSFSMRAQREKSLAASSDQVSIILGLVLAVRKWMLG